MNGDANRNSPPARIIFAGSPDFAVPTLALLAASRHEVVAVLTQPDRPAGRGRKLRPSEVKGFAVDHGIDVLQPERLSGEEIQRALTDLQPDLAVVAAYGLLLPPAVLSIPRAGCVNVHASLLPRWRGASPVQAALLAGDAETGVSIMQMEAGLDTGPVFATRTTAIRADDTADTLEQRLAEIGAALLGEIVDDILTGAASATAQDGDAATYAGRISKQDAKIDWRASAGEIDRKIRAYNSWPVAETLLDGERMRCWSAAPVDSPVDDRPTSGDPPGAVVAVSAAGIDVQTGAGTLRLTEIQMPGRRRVAAAQFAHGYPLAGKVLGQ
ncbi:MAG: methionyl-tRNA formyltransferase [Gammaproteobacteria bacterium]